MREIEKELRGRGELTVTRDKETGERLNTHVEGRDATVRLSRMFDGQRKLEIEHGHEANAERDHDKIADDGHRKRGTAARPTKSFFFMGWEPARKRRRTG